MKNSSYFSTNHNICDLIRIIFRNELQFQKDKNSEMKDKTSSLISELKSLQQQYVVMQNMQQQTNQKLETELINERRMLKSVEEELKMKSQVINSNQ